MGSRTVRTSGYPGGNRPPTTPVDVPSYHIAAEPLALPRILLPSPGAWLDGHWQLARGGSAVCAGEPLVGLAALAAPAAPRTDGIAVKKTRKLRRIHVPLFLTPNSARQRALKGVERYLQLLG